MTGLFTTILSFLEGLFLSHGSFGVFIAFFVAQIIAPIPDALLMIGSGFFFLKDGLTASLVGTLVFKIAIPASFGLTLGSLVLFYIGFFLGKPFLDRWGKFFGLSWEEIEKFQSKFEKGYLDEATLFITRALPIFPTSPISFICGLIRLRVWPYFIFTFLGTFVRVSLLAVLGWQVGSVYHLYAPLFDKLEWIGLVLIAIFILSFILYKIRSKKKQKIQIFNN